MLTGRTTRYWVETEDFVAADGRIWPRPGREVTLMSLPQNPMQLLPEYKSQLNPEFRSWYERIFTSDRRAYWHWSVTCRDSDDIEYHLSVRIVDGNVLTTVNTPPSQDLTAHTFARNYNSFAVCFEAMTGATTDDLGPNAPTPGQIREFIRVCIWYFLALHVPVGNAMAHWEAANNLDHSEALRSQGNTGGNDAAAQALGLPHANYGPHSDDFERWDLYCWVNRKTLELRSAFQPRPEGEDWLPFCDYLRGEIILGMQAETKQKWSVTK